MTTLTLVILGLSWSAICAAMLALTDPKRRRHHNRNDQELHLKGTSRNLFWVALLLPGLVTGGVGDWSAFTNWLGACTVLSWLIVVWWPSSKAT